MEYQATAKYVRMSPRKVQLVARSVHHLKPADALSRLHTLPKRAGENIADVIKSALAGAKDKKADTLGLRIKAIETLRGPGFKLFPFFYILFSNMLQEWFGNKR